MPRAGTTNLIPIYMRLVRDDVAEARRKAAAIGVPYQHVIREWVNERATRSRETERPVEPSVDALPAKPPRARGKSKRATAP